MTLGYIVDQNRSIGTRNNLIRQDETHMRHMTRQMCIHVLVSAVVCVCVCTVSGKQNKKTAKG